jgi:archaemetzincin
MYLAYSKNTYLFDNQSIIKMFSKIEERKKGIRHWRAFSIILVSLLFFWVACEDVSEKKSKRIEQKRTGTSTAIGKVQKKDIIEWKDEIYGQDNAGKFNYSFNQFNDIILKINPLHTKMGKPKSGDWLAQHQERGQTFQQYLSDKPIKLDNQRRKIYLLPLGSFDKSDKRLLTAVAEYLALFFEIEVVLQAPQSLRNFPPEAFRTRNLDYPGNPQYLTKHILHKVLLPNLPTNALAYMAITNEDLYPQASWNFVFGQASTQKRVGVSSYFRYLQEEKPVFNQILRRIIATSSHEIGHILTMYHCKAYECVMNGSNSLHESDSRPIYPCSECIAKLSWNLGFSIPQHYENLVPFFEKHQLNDEANYCQKLIALGFP